MTKKNHHTKSARKKKPDFIIDHKLSGIQLLFLLVDYDVEKLFAEDVVSRRISYADVKTCLDTEPENFKEIVATGRHYGFSPPPEFKYSDLKAEDTANSRVNIGLALFYNRFPIAYHYSISGWLWDSKTFQKSKDLALLTYESMAPEQKSTFVKKIFIPLNDHRGLSQKEKDALGGIESFLPNIGNGPYLTIELVNTIIKGNNEGMAFAYDFMKKYFAHGIPAGPAKNLVGALSDVNSQVLVDFLLVHYDKALIEPFFEKLENLDLENKEHLRRYENILKLLAAYSNLDENLEDHFSPRRDIASKIWTTYVKIGDQKVAEKMHMIFDLIPVSILDDYYKKESKIKTGPYSKMRLDELALHNKDRYQKYIVP